MIDLYCSKLRAHFIEIYLGAINYSSISGVGVISFLALLFLNGYQLQAGSDCLNPKVEEKNQVIIFFLGIDLQKYGFLIQALVIMEKVIGFIY